jgi:hypothetical protein
MTPVVADWRELCRHKGLRFRGDEIEIVLKGNRKHFMQVQEEADAYRVSALVATASIFDKVDDLPILSWKRNHGAELVGFMVDGRGRLVAESWIPKAGLSGDEFQFYLHAVAAEADRYEYQLLGGDWA